MKKRDIMEGGTYAYTHRQDTYTNGRAKAVTVVNKKTAARRSKSTVETSEYGIVETAFLWEEWHIYQDRMESNRRAHAAAWELIQVNRRDGMYVSVSSDATGAPHLSAEISGERLLHHVLALLQKHPLQLDAPIVKLLQEEDALDILLA